MHRKYTIKDLEGKKNIIKVYPELGSRIEFTQMEIVQTVDDHKILDDMILLIEKYMGKNSINKIEIEEIV